MCVCACVYVCNMYVFECINVYIYMYVCMYVCMYGCGCVCICVYVCMYVCMYVLVRARHCVNKCRSSYKTRLN